jgi:hypothetical protein
MTLARISVAAASVLLLIAGCDKHEGASGTAPVASAAASGTTGPIHYSSRLPGKGKHALLGRGIRGGSGDSRPTINSKRLSEASTDRQLRKPALADKVDCAPASMDNAAECDGTSMYFCDDNALWVISCSEEAQLSGLENGSCFEGETFTDCLGCGKADDGTDVCCDFQLTKCCATDGTCYDPKN